jgi:hypothetical protein
MRVAPPVRALSCGAGPWTWIQQGLYILSAFVLAHWAGSHVEADAFPLALGSVGLGLAAAALAVRCLRQPRMELIWDGAAWAVESALDGRCAGQAMLMLDLGAWMLVRFTPAVPATTRGPGSVWLPLSWRDAGASWHGLRVALYAWPALGDTPGPPRRPFPAA